MIYSNNHKEITLSTRYNDNLEIIKRYVDQPAILPEAIRTIVEQLWNKTRLDNQTTNKLPYQAVQLYALTDLTPQLKLAQIWILLGPAYLAIAKQNADGKVVIINNIDRTEIKKVREVPGLSCTVLSILGNPDEPAHAVIRYTHRQRHAVDNIRFILENQDLKDDVIPNSADEMYADALTHDIREAQNSFVFNKLSVLSRLLAYLKPYRTQLIFGGIAAIIFTCLDLFPPVMTGYLIDKVIKPFQGGTLNFADASRLGWIIIIGILATKLFSEAFVWIRLRTLSVMGELVASDLRRDIYAHLQKLSISFFSSKQTGSIISRVGSDTDRLWDFIAFGIVEVSISVIMLFGLGIMLVSLDWQLGLVLLIPVPLLIFAIFLNGESLQPLFLSAWRNWSNMTDVLSDTVPGIRVVKAFNQEEHEKNRFNNSNTTVTNHFKNIHYNWTTFWPLLMMAIHVIMVLVWIFALPRIITTNPTNTLSIGKFVSFLMYMTMFMQPIDIIGQMARMLNRATSSAHRIFELLDTEPTIVDCEEPIKLAPVKGEIEFEHVNFGYDGVRLVLKDISFGVKPGEMIGLVGPSGAGKTTIINLIVRFYQPTGGSILIDGINLNHLDTGDYRKQVGMVLQDPYLFHGSVLDNIRYADPNTTFDRIIEAAKAANAHDFICKLPQGYETIVGERGHTLSGGERQRVSIARAILNNPRILILDEATSSVDTETERKIQEAIDNLVKGRTVIAIAHRLSTLTRANRLLVIDNGQIKEQGTHSELLEIENGLYRKLFNMQRDFNNEIFAME